MLRRAAERLVSLLFLLLLTRRSFLYAVSHCYKQQSRLRCTYTVVYGGLLWACLLPQRSHGIPNLVSWSSGLVLLLLTLLSSAVITCAVYTSVCVCTLGQKETERSSPCRFPLLLGQTLLPLTLLSATHCTQSSCIQLPPPPSVYLSIDLSLSLPVCLARSL